jgi:hypothetical protein
VFICPEAAWPRLRENRSSSDWYKATLEALKAAAELKDINITQALLKDVIRQYPDVQKRPRVMAVTDGAIK